MMAFVQGVLIGLIILMFFFLLFKIAERRDIQMEILVTLPAAEVTQPDPKKP